LNLAASQIKGAEILELDVEFALCKLGDIVVWNVNPNLTFVWLLLD